MSTRTAPPVEHGTSSDVCAAVQRCARCGRGTKSWAVPFCCRPGACARVYHREYGRLWRAAHRVPPQPRPVRRLPLPRIGPDLRLPAAVRVRRALHTIGIEPSARQLRRARLQIGLITAWFGYRDAARIRFGECCRAMVLFVAAAGRVWGGRLARRTLQQWIQRYNRAGLAAFLDRRGRPRRDRCERVF